jgi:hypothetical protein
MAKMSTNLPDEISKYLPAGYEPRQGVWLVLPETGGDGRDGIDTVNEWLRAEDWYPESLQKVIWFGDDGTGNFFGWDPQDATAILWNPEDGDNPLKTGAVSELWQFVLKGYRDAI